LVFAALVVTAGCQRHQQKEVEVPALEPEIETISVTSDYAKRAMAATGGWEAWKKAKEIQLDCVVTFYCPDGSFYLTEQRYDVHPLSNSIMISGVEPQGSVVWQLSKGQLAVLEGPGQAESLPAAVGRRCMAEAVLNIITAPARFLDESVEFVKQAAPVKMHGQWYDAIDRRNKPAVETSRLLAEAVFHQNRDDARVDMIRLVCAAKDKSLTVRGYDYEPLEKGGLCVPTRIEIFRTAAGDSQERLVKIDCYGFRTS